ncbi:MAG TPA: adenylate/guanylate cyclase domain-containing protein [Intrasporangium sp.]|uniref:adenylate/guanylate cyclase domain-containing protein n=1 Tax=Intrasporangium sp. TaxID=1925024 RepID=UPI002B47D0E6|nr:adenylate/guanylate cyclase domain-containing protein [Intrasporangium sp.]HKX67345.1 adenylate/guanylate cyclase domain-containing protein [Intrasporangium sp.]
MSPLPRGTLTLLFSDIEGSTSLLTGLGPRWGEALSAHRVILRDVFAKHGGREVGTEGDSFFVVFTSATDAVAAAIDVQRGLAEHDWPEGRSLRVRIGLHTGEPQVHEDNYIGIDIHRAARIMATAHGGQIVISQATHALVSEALPAELFLDLGRHRLKDLTDPEHLYEIVAPGLAQTHPPLRTLGMAANLPVYRTDLLGRDAELRAITAAIQSDGARLVTLTGPGGTGKTRLAVAAAKELQARAPGDVFFVPLQSADRATVMWAGIGEAVGAPMGTAEETPAQRTLAFLRERGAVLVLDNLEQISDAADVVAQLLQAAPLVTALVTSRRPLHLVGEWQYPLSPLSVPRATRGRLAREVVEQSPAVRLFVERARMVRPSFALTTDTVDDVVELCRRLDGLPLAIELAAARSRLLGPRGLLARLDRWFGEAVLEGDRPERQRTLTATISWSYDMLTESDRRVLRQLGVFSSRIGLDAVEAVVEGEGRDPLDVVADLVDASLLEVRDGPDGEPVVYLLETIGRFALDRLEEQGEADAARQRHAEWCIRVAREFSAVLHAGPRQLGALDRFESVIEDLRAALDWTLSPTAPRERFELGLELLEPMDTYWYRFGYVQEGRGWSDRAMALLDKGHQSDSPQIVDALHGHGILALQQNDIAAGTQVLERALAMAHRLDDVSRESRESNSLGIGRREQGDVEAARELIERSIELARQIGDKQREATGLTNLAPIHIDRGDYAAATQAARRAIEADEARQDPWGVAINQTNLISALLHAEGPRPALRKLLDTAPSTIALGDMELSICVVENFASVWAALGDGQRAAALVGAADRHREAVGMPRTAPDRAILDRFVTRARSDGDNDEWNRAYAAGRNLTIEAAVAQGSIALDGEEAVP